MTIVDIYQNITDFLTSLWDSIQGAYNSFLLFFDIIPDPFNTIIKIFIPVFLVALIIKIKGNLWLKY